MLLLNHRLCAGLAGMLIGLAPAAAAAQSQAPSETEGRAASETEGRAASETEGRAASEPEGRAAPSETEGRAASETEGRAASETEGRAASETEGRAAPKTPLVSGDPAPDPDLDPDPDPDPAPRHSRESGNPDPDPDPEADLAPEPALELSGYGQVLFRFHNYGPDQTRPGGSPPDSRLVFDTTRFVLELEGEIAEGLEWEAEIELEHGGTGATLELEHGEEFGEVEQEIEQGGEVVLEELYLEREISDRLSVKAGRFYVAVGLLSDLNRPTDLLGAARPESETTVLPAVWDELGIAAELSFGRTELTLQLVNGLDSSRFSSQRWVALGHQGVFELIRATGLAAVARIDAHALPGLVIGASGYAGDTVPNRPNPDMEGIFAPVVITDVHAIYDRWPVRARAVAIWGHLDDAARISEKNGRLSNSLGAPRTPVAEQALAAWAEVGVDVSPFLGLGPLHRLEPFFRLERYDTMLATGSYTFDNPRFSRTVLATGLGYTLAGRAVAIADVVYRRLGSSDYRPETTVELGLGFTY